MYEGLYLNAMREIADLRGKVYDLEKDCLRLIAENKRFREALNDIISEALTARTLCGFERIAEIATATLEEK